MMWPRILKTGFCLGLLFFFALPVFARDGIRFLFLGDLHYLAPNSRNAETVEDLAKDVREKGYQVDFVCHTGDLIENQKDGHPIPLEEGKKQWEFALSHIKKTFDAPFFMCPGNHDWYGGDSWFGGKKNIEEMFLPFISQQLGRPVSKPFYAFRWDNSYFLFLNHYGFDLGWDIEQLKWLEKSLSYADDNPAIKHVFLFAHPYLWNLDHFRYNENDVYLKTIARHRKVEVYFCGHSHLNTASVWNFGPEHKCLQLTGCPIEEAKELSVPPESARRLVLNPPPSRRGYLRRYGKTQGYFLVSVQREKVTVSFDVIGGRREWEFCWQKPGEITEVKAPPEPARTYLNPGDLARISEARLYLFPYTPGVLLPERQELSVFFNGEKVGALPRNTDWVWGGGSFISIPARLVREENDIVIPNPAGEGFALRDCCFWVKLNDRKEVQTDVYPLVLFSVPWRDIYADFGLSHPTAGVLGSSIEENVPGELIKSFKPGSPVSFKLAFPALNGKQKQRQGRIY